MKRKLLAILTAVCMTVSFAEELRQCMLHRKRVGKDEVIVTMPTTSEPKQVLTLHMDGEPESMYTSR